MSIEFSVKLLPLVHYVVSMYTVYKVCPFYFFYLLFIFLNFCLQNLHNKLR